MKDLNDALKDWRKVREDMEKFATRTPNIIASEALKVIDENFEKEGYDNGNGFVPWEPRAEVTNKAYDKRYGVKGSVFNSGNKILQQTGNLRDGIRKKVTNYLIWIGFSTQKIPYGQAHNEGVPGKTPQRQFMPIPGEGPSPKILTRAFAKVKAERDRIMKIFKR